MELVCIIGVILVTAIISFFAVKYAVERNIRKLMRLFSIFLIIGGILSLIEPEITLKEYPTASFGMGAVILICTFIIPRKDGE